MKQLRFSNGDGSLDITYLVDLIGTNDACTVYQVIQKVNNVNTPFGLNAAAYAAGFPDIHGVDSQQTTLAAFKSFADTNNYTLVEYDGTTSTTLHSLTALNITTASLTTKVHAVLQKETAVVVGTITTSGNATVTVTSALLDEAEVISIAVLENDTANVVAEKIRAALEDNANIAANFTVGGTDANVSLEVLVAAANDTTLNIAYTNDDCAGLTPDASSNDTTDGSAGTLVNQTIRAVGGNTPYVWSTESTLPEGVVLRPSGVLYGLPMEAGTFPVVLRCTDRFGIYDESISMDLVIS